MGCFPNSKAHFKALGFNKLTHFSMHSLFMEFNVIMQRL